jgi:hypothetical protein
MNPLIFSPVRRVFPSGIFGELNKTSADEVTANTVTVTDGTISSGTVADTRTINQTYLVVNESGQFKIDFKFTGLDGMMGQAAPKNPASVVVVGRYVGNPAHNVKIQAWNYDTTAWVNLTADANDFPSSLSDSESEFPFPDLSGDYVNVAGEAQVRIEHTSSAVITHNMYIDFIKLDLASVEMPTGNTAVAITNLDENGSFKVGLDGTDGEITIQKAGWYLVMMTLSASSSAGTTMHCHGFINGVEQHTLGISRYFGDTGKPGSGASFSYYNLSVGDVLQLKVRADLSDTYLSFDHVGLGVLRVR